MDATISGMVIGYTFMVIIYVEMIMRKKPLTQSEIDEYQKVLDKIDINAKINFDIDMKHDSRTELMEQRKQAKSFVLIFSGIFLGITMIALACTTTLMTLDNTGLSCASAIVLIIYGMIKIAESKKIAIAVLSFVLIAGTLANFAFEKAMAASPYAYWYLCGLILLLGLFTLIPKAKKLRG